jgi:hypothetical protein
VQKCEEQSCKIIAKYAAREAEPKIKKISVKETVAQ